MGKPLKKTLRDTVRGAAVALAQSLLRDMFVLLVISVSIATLLVAFIVRIPD